MNNLKIKTYFNLLKKANKIVYGYDNIKNYHKKAYLIIMSNNYNIKNKIIQKAKEFANCLVYEIEQEGINNLLELTNCKVILINNYELSKAILLENENLNLLREVKLIESNTKQ